MKELITEMDRSVLDSGYKDVSETWDKLKTSIVAQRFKEIENLKLVINMIKTESLEASQQVLLGMIERLKNE